MTNRTRR